MKNYAAAVKQKHLTPSVNTEPPRTSDVSKPAKQARVDVSRCGGFVNPRPKYAALFSYSTYMPNLVVPIEEKVVEEIRQPARYVAPNPPLPTKEEWQQICAHNRSIGAAFRTDRPAPFKQCCKGHLQPFCCHTRILVRFS